MGLIEVNTFNDGSLDPWAAEPGANVSVETVWNGTLGVVVRGPAGSASYGVGLYNYGGIYRTMDFSAWARPIIVVPMRLYSPDPNLYVICNIRIVTPTRAVSIRAFSHAGSGTYSGPHIIVLDLRNIFGDDSWKASTTIYLEIAVYVAASGTYDLSACLIEYDSISIFDAPDKFLYAPIIAGSKYTQYNSIPVDEDVSGQDLYMFASVVAGTTNVVPETLTVNVIYDRVDAASRSAQVTPATPPYGNWFAGSASDTDQYLTVLRRVKVLVKSTDFDHITKLLVAVGGMDGEWAVRRLCALYLDIHEYPMEEDKYVSGAPPLTRTFTVSYHHRLLATVCLTPSATTVIGDPSSLSGSHTIDLYDAATGALIDYIELLFPSLSAKGACISPEQFYGSEILGTEYINLSATGTVDYYLLLTASVVGAVTALDQVPDAPDWAYYGGTYAGAQTGPVDISFSYGTVSFYYSFTDKYGISEGALVLVRSPLRIAQKLGLLKLVVKGGSKLQTANVGTLEATNGASFGLAIVYLSRGTIVRADAYALIDAMEDDDKPLIYVPPYGVSVPLGSVNYDLTTLIVAAGGKTANETVTVDSDTVRLVDLGSLIDTTVAADEVIVELYAHIYSSQSAGDGVVDVKVEVW